MVRKRRFTLQWWPDPERRGFSMLSLDDGQDYAAIRTDATPDDREQWGGVLSDLMRALVSRRTTAG